MRKGHGERIRLRMERDLFYKRLRTRTETISSP
jgi:hypothetical protein